MQDQHTSVKVRKNATVKENLKPKSGLHTESSERLSSLELAMSHALRQHYTMRFVIPRGLKFYGTEKLWSRLSINSLTHMRNRHERFYACIYCI